MKIYLCASKYCYGYIPEVKINLETIGHEVIMPECLDEPMKEEEMKKLGEEAHKEFKKKMLHLQNEKIALADCILVLNFEKNGQPNYIGGATFLEIFKTVDSGKKAYLYNPIPDNNFKDELIGMEVEVISGDLTKIN